jgi:1,5-anhydro-D-fructose reductase (1,5-anhydro-D-mannitol-forming)
MGEGYILGMAIRWGIIGCGDVCEVKSGPALQKAAGSALVAVMRRDGAKAADFARRHGVPRWYDDADKLIHDQEVDAVYIATPPGSHEAYALRVAAVGKPCYVEKPMARNYAECVRMVEAFRAANLPLYVAYYRRRLPRFVKAKQFIDEGRLGRVTGLVYRHTRLFRPSQGGEWRLDPEHSGGGLLFDLGSHALDLFDYLLGPLSGVSGHAARFSDGRAEDAVAMSFQTGCGAPGSAIWNFAGATRNDVIEIDGTNGRLVMACFGDDPVRLETPDGGVERFDLPNPPHIQQPFIQSMVDELSGRATEPCPSTGESAARTNRVMDEALQSYYGSRADGFWNR